MEAGANHKRVWTDQVECLNKQTIELLEKIKKYDDDPLIIFQGDHGSEFLQIFDTPLAKLSEDQFVERFAILNVLRFPISCRHLLYSTLSPINTFRLVLSCLDGKEWSLEKDEAVLYSDWKNPGLGKTILRELN